MKIILYKGKWTVKNVQNEPRLLFIFSNNIIKNGYFGQSVIRGQKNAFGISTKQNVLDNKYIVSFSDNNCDKTISTIFDKLQKIIDALQSGEYDGICMSENYIGFNKSKIQLDAPKTFVHFNSVMCQFMKLVDQN